MDLKFFASGTSRVSFPLTPALSPRERENLAQRAAKTIALGGSTRGVRGSLSPGQRAGVGGNKAHYNRHTTSNSETLELFGVSNLNKDCPERLSRQIRTIFSFASFCVFGGLDCQASLSCGDFPSLDGPVGTDNDGFGI